MRFRTSSSASTSGGRLSIFFVTSIGSRAEVRSRNSLLLVHSQRGDGSLVVIRRLEPHAGSHLDRSRHLTPAPASAPAPLTLRVFYAREKGDATRSKGAAPRGRIRPRRPITRGPELTAAVAARTPLAPAARFRRFRARGSPRRAAGAPRGSRSWSPRASPGGGSTA